MDWSARRPASRGGQRVTVRVKDLLMYGRWYAAAASVVVELEPGGSREVLAGA
ncbi:hypothetical protein V3N99_21285 [Dermatophilaceae bacterium Soc4.6]